MKKSIFILSTLLLLVSCEPNGVTLKDPIADFYYEVTQPMTVILHNKSSYDNYWDWNFGDGTTSTAENPTHRYDKIGVYKIKLTSYNSNGTSDTHEEVITIEAPTKCYYAGYTITKIPSNNYYYQVQLTDDYIMSKTLYSWTNWVLLSSANLPYDYIFDSPKQIDITKDYVIRLYKSSSKPSNSAASGSGDASATIKSEQLKTYPDVLFWKESNIEMKIYFSWK